MNGEGPPPEKKAAGKEANPNRRDQRPNNVDGLVTEFRYFHKPLVEVRRCLEPSEWLALRWLAESGPGIERFTPAVAPRLGGAA